MSKPDLILPTSGNLNQPFGVNKQMYSQAIYGGLNGHNGVDFMTNTGWTICASHDGYAYHEIDAGGGHGVVVVSLDGSYKTIYWHLTNPQEHPEFISPIYGKGTVKVETGDVIGYSNNTGVSNGSHLHWGLKFMKDGQTINKDNGFLGAVDPMPYCNGYTPEEFLKLKQKASILKQLIDLWTTLKTLLK